MIIDCSSNHNIHETKLISEACDTLIVMIDNLPRSEARKTLINNIISSRNLNDTLIIKIETANEKLSSDKCELCNKTIEPKMSINTILEYTHLVKDIQQVTNLINMIERIMTICSHSHRAKEIEILKESCNNLHEQLVAECDDNDQRSMISLQIIRIHSKIEYILQIIEMPEQTGNKCTFCDKKINYNKKNYIDWTSLLEDIKYLDKDLENVQIEELICNVP